MGAETLSSRAEQRGPAGSADGTAETRCRVSVRTLICVRDCESVRCDMRVTERCVTRRTFFDGVQLGADVSCERKSRNRDGINDR